MAGDPDTFRVAPSLSGLPQLSATPVQNAAPEQMQRLGQAVQGAGQVAGQIYTDVLKEQNATRVTDALTQLTERRNQITYDPNDGWAAQRGKNALERPNGKALDEEFGGIFDNQVETLAMGLGNDAQRREFQARAQAMGLDFRQRIGAHVAQESSAYQLETQAGLTKTGQNQLAIARTPDEMAEAQAMISQAATRIFELKGTPLEAQQDVLRDLMTPGHSAQLNRRMEADDIDGAEAYFAMNRNQMTTEFAARAESALLEQRTLIDGRNIGEQLFASMQAAPPPRAPGGQPAPVADGAALAKQLFPEARITSGYRGPNHPLSRANPDSYHTRTHAAVDMAPIAGMTFAQAKARFEQAGYSMIQAIDETGKGQSAHATGDHWHFVLGQGGGSSAPSTQGKTRLQAIEELNARDLPERTRQAALSTINELYGAQKEAKQEREDNLLSAAYAEVDSRGYLSSSTLSQLTAAGLGSQIPGLRSFAAATKARAAGGTVAEADGLEAYGRTQIEIASGTITTMDQLMRVKPFVSDTLFKQLTDDLAASPQDARSRASAAIKMVDTEIAGSGLFRDKDGKETPETRREYQQFVGAVVSTLAGRRLAGQPSSYEEDRRVVLGLLANDTVGGERMRNYDIRALYDNIPARARLVATRAIEARGENASVARVVDMWQSMTDAGRARYTGSTK